MADEFLYKLGWMKEHVLCRPVDHLYLPQMDKVLFFNYTFYYSMKDTHMAYYGSFYKELGVEYTNLPPAGWDISLERKLYYAILELGIVKSIASPFPVGESPFE